MLQVGDHEISLDDSTRLEGKSLSVGYRQTEYLEFDDDVYYAGTHALAFLMWRCSLGIRGFEPYFTMQKSPSIPARALECGGEIGI